MLNLGILAAGGIARKMAKTITSVDCGVRPYAVAARDGARAAAFAKEFGFETSYEGYGALLADPAVDVVYVATTHNFHKENVRAALEAGKHVLCEKPMTTNEKDARELFELAKQKNLLLSEAVWTRCMPFVSALRASIESGAIGRVHLLTANMGAKLAEKDRIARPELAGGVLLDFAMYTLTIADIVLGEPSEQPVGVCEKNSLGMDIQDAIVMKYPGGAVASLSATGCAASDNKAVVYGDKGRIEFSDFWHPQELAVIVDGRDVKRLPLPFDATGYEYEVREFVRTVESGALECPSLPAQATLRILRQMDKLRKDWDTRYPFE